MMRVDTAPRAEVVLRRARIEPVNSQRLFAGVERDAADVGRHCHRATHPAIRTGAATSGVKSVGQFHSEAHGTAVACRFHFPCFIRLHGQAPDPALAVPAAWRWSIAVLQGLSKPERYLPRSSTSWVCVTSAQRGQPSHSSSASRLTAGALLIVANVCRPA